MLDIYRHNYGKESLLFAGICARLDILFERKITENLTQLFYPAITARFIYTFGLCEPENTKIPIRKFLMIMLKNNFLHAYRTNSDLAMDMLSTDTEYDQETQTLKQKNLHRYRRNKEIQTLKLMG